MLCPRGSSLFSDPPTAPGIFEAASTAGPAAAAARYLALGFSVIPLRGKVPLVRWREYQQRRPAQAELRRWARRGLFQNVGIVCGEVSGSLVVLDFDVPGAYDAFRGRFPDLADTYTVATGGGGRHVYLRVEALPPSLRGKGVELCANGRLVVAPPSLHPNGTPYRVERALDIRRVSDLSDVVGWIRPHLTRRVSQPQTGEAAGSGKLDPALVAAIAGHFRALGYRQKGDWLNGPCIYPERHAHNDARPSFGFNMQTGYGWCFVCGSMLAKEISKHLGYNDCNSTDQNTQVTPMDYSHWSGKPKRACFNCRKCFKDRTYHQFETQTKTCPHCGGELHNMGTHFKAPRRSDDKAWEAIEMLYEAGVRYTVFDWHQHACPESYKRKRETGETVEEYILEGVLADIGIALPRAEADTADSVQPPKAEKKPWCDPHKTQWRGPRPTHPREVPAFLKWWKEQNLDRIAIAVEACEKLGYQPPEGFEGELLLEKMKKQFGLD